MKEKSSEDELVNKRTNELPTNVRTAESLSISRKRLKTPLLRLHIDPAYHDSLPTHPLVCSYQ